ncbi:HGGxSTG domain-containing protein [Aurantimonas sp. C2-6-R+9]|uniref:HGGxSTG domain-containing protein n=1 Tax=unclassified Aurantimonas TaxID=2638230 RepID=UPI002E17CD3E|nr:HGGxSTG domain-containing protein [Aurantimonas sp. C2-6-R+9]
MEIDPLQRAPRCGATSKRSGKPCRSPAMANGRCRMHGGKSTGPAKGSQNALKHGLRTAEAIQRRKSINALLRGNREALVAAGI